MSKSIDINQIVVQVETDVKAAMQGDVWAHKYLTDTLDSMPRRKFNDVIEKVGRDIDTTMGKNVHGLPVVTFSPSIAERAIGIVTQHPVHRISSTVPHQQKTNYCIDWDAVNKKPEKHACTLGMLPED